VAISQQLGLDRLVPSGHVPSGREVEPRIDRRHGAINRYRKVAAAMAVSDVLCLLAAVGAAYVLRFRVTQLPVDLLLVFGVALLAWPLIFKAFSLYSPAQLHPAEEFKRILGATGAGVAFLMLAGYWFGSSLSRPLVATAGLTVLVLELAVRRVWRWRIGRLKTDGRLALRTLIIGTNEEAKHVAQTLTRPGLGYTPLGYLAFTPLNATPNGLPLLGQVSEVEDAIRQHDADCLFVASSATDVHTVQVLAKVARRSGVHLRVSAMLPETLSGRLSVQPIGGVMTLSLSPIRLTGSQAALKRAADLSLSMLGLFLLIPAALVIAAVIKGTSKGPVLYRQERVGRRGRLFTIYKFRTMVDGADSMNAELAEKNEASGPLFKMKDDPRVTAVGRSLRKWSLDELPQLLNVIRGDMSLVGPRPPLPRELMRYQDSHFDRLEVRPGITGLWQVSGRSSLSFEDYVRLDLFYIENWSLAYDLFILLKTLPVVLTRKGAY
jgi:exopolysaccharide biosynthesis polyprenyl glycosylphosphotransferase